MPSTWQEQRAWMVERQLVCRGITDRSVLEAMGAVPREEFVQDSWLEYAYHDVPLPIGYEQTISQPYVVALMASALCLDSTDIVLDVGTGSGYAAAVLSLLCAKVFSIELKPQLALESSVRLDRLGYSNVQVRQGDGWHGWPENAPFDGIAVAAAAEHVPGQLLSQLAPGGRLVLPVGGADSQELLLYERISEDEGQPRARQAAGFHQRPGFEVTRLGPVAFVPLVHPGLDQRT